MNMPILPTLDSNVNQHMGELLKDGADASIISWRFSAESTPFKAVEKDETFNSPYLN